MRNITDAVAAQLSSKHFRCALLCELRFLNSVEYVWSGVGSIPWNGQTWLGLGQLAQVGTITEESQLRAQSLTLTLTGVDNALLSEALTEVHQDLPVKLWLAFLADDGSIVADPIACFAGRMDRPTIKEGTDTSTIIVEVENRLADLQRPLVRRFTDQDQRLDFPDDSGFGWVAQMMDWNSSWGIASKQ